MQGLARAYRGAPLGRVNYADSRVFGCIWIERVPLNASGYDEGGAYWGQGAPLWWIASLDRNATLDYYTRAQTRDEALANLATAGIAYNMAVWE